MAFFFFFFFFYIGFFFFFFFFLGVLGVGGAQGERKRIPIRLHTHAEPDMGLSTPWDHDLSQNQELDAQPAEPPSCPGDDFLKCIRFSLLIFC